MIHNVCLSFVPSPSLFVCVCMCMHVCVHAYVKVVLMLYQCPTGDDH